MITRQELDRRLGGTREEIGRLEERLRQLELTSLSDGMINTLIGRMLQNLDGFLTVRNLNNGQLKQLISKIEVDKDGNVDVYLHVLPERFGAGPVCWRPR